MSSEFDVYDFSLRYQVGVGERREGGREKRREGGREERRKGGRERGGREKEA